MTCREFQEKYLYHSLFDQSQKSILVAFDEIISRMPASDSDRLSPNLLIVLPAPGDVAMVIPANRLHAGCVRDGTGSIGVGGVGGAATANGGAATANGGVATGAMIILDQSLTYRPIEQIKTSIGAALASSILHYGTIRDLDALERAEVNECLARWGCVAVRAPETESAAGAGAGSGTM